MDVAKGPGCDRDQTIYRLVAQYQTALLRMCYLYLHDEALAEDAVQETFIKAYRAMDGLRSECSEKSWLMRIAVNTCRDMQRSGWFRHVDRRVTPDALPEAAQPFEEADEELTLAIMKLPNKCREVFVLRYYQNMGVTEIASVLGVVPSTVSNQLNRAQKKLRAMLERGRFHG